MSLSTRFPTNGLLGNPALSCVALFVLRDLCATQDRTTAEFPTPDILGNSYSYARIAYSVSYLDGGVGEWFPALILGNLEAQKEGRSADAPTILSMHRGSRLRH